MSSPIVISGCIGPRGDGYDASHQLGVDEGEGYHRPQVETFADSHADLITALTMTHPEEAIGIVRAARRVEIPVVIGFTVETDARLPSGHTLVQAIAAVDCATDADVVYYAINCAHPTHFADELTGAESARWLERLGAIRANASSKSHAELDEATELDDGEPSEFAAECVALRCALPNLNVIGGCCGTDHRHIDAVAEAVWPGTMQEGR